MNHLDDIKYAEDDFIRLGTLFAYYGGVLSDKSAKIFSLYYEENFSLTEIAQNFAMSRQGVHNNIRQSQKKLESFEEALGLIEKQAKLSEIIKQLEQFASKGDIKQIKLMIEELREDGI